MRQRVDELFGARDAVEIAGNGLEAIIGRYRAVGKTLDLLQHRIRAARGKDIPREKQHGQSIGMRQRRRRHHVGGAGSDGTGANHCALPSRLFCKGDGGVGHGLFVMGSIRGNLILRRVQRFAEAGDIAVAENGPNARKISHFCRMRSHILARQVSNRRLRGRASNRFHVATTARALRHAFTNVENLRAIASMAALSLIESANQARATSWKTVRPIAKPFTTSNGAAAAKQAMSSASDAACPSSSTPRHSGSC